MKKLPEWTVYISNFNSNQIERYNIFTHGSFFEDVCKIVSKYNKANGEGVVNNTESTDWWLSEEIRKSAMYYFWSKCEWEVVITDWPREEVAKKIDVYQQIRLNWNIFINYIKENINSFPSIRNKKLMWKMIGDYKDNHRGDVY